MPDVLKEPSSSGLLSQVQNKLIKYLHVLEKRYEDLVGHLRDIVFHLNLDLKWTFLIIPMNFLLEGYVYLGF